MKTSRPPFSPAQLPARLVRGGSEVAAFCVGAFAHIFATRELMLGAQVAQTVHYVLAKRRGCWFAATSAAAFQTHASLIASLSAARGHHF